MNRFVIPIAIALAVLPLSATADTPEDSEQLTRRLRACLSSGSAGAPRDSLLSAVVAVRSLCAVQIARLREQRLMPIDASFGLPGAKLTRSQEEALERARDAESRKLNDEIALAISNFTGLTL